MAGVTAFDISGYFGASASVSATDQSVTFSLGDISVSGATNASQIVAALVLKWFETTNTKEADVNYGVILQRSGESLRSIGDVNLRAQNFLLQLRRLDETNAINPLDVI